MKVAWLITDCMPFTGVLLQECTSVADVPFTLVAGLLAKVQYPVGPATGHLGTGFLGFPVSISEC